MSSLFELRQYCYKVYLTLLKRHIDNGSMIPSDEEEICIKSFCVLTHAAIEEHFEELSTNTLAIAYKKYKSGKFISQIPSTLAELDEINDLLTQLIKTLILSSSYSVFSKGGSEVFNKHVATLENISGNLSSGNMPNITRETFSYSKDLMKETVRFMQGTIENNHGTSLKYLLKILIPVGIDVPNNMNFLNSLQKLAEFRGSYAHKGMVEQLVSASDVAKYIVDILKLCGIVDEKLKKFHLYSIQNES